MIDKGREVDVAYFFSRTFDTVFHDVLIDKLTYRGMDEWTETG